MSMIFNKPSVFSSPEWMSTPFVGVEKDAYQQLADIILTMPHCTASLDIPGSIRKVFKSPIPPTADVESCKKLASKLLADLNRWAIAHPHLTKVIAQPLDQSVALEPTDASVKSPEVPNSFLRLVALNYMSTQMVLNMLLHKIKAGDDYHGKAARGAAAVLGGIVDITMTQAPGMDSMRCLPPLIMVMCAAPTPELEMNAQKMLQGWSAKLGGLGPMISRI
jgi:hypothetical protein